jgi:hypothetical protein
LRQADPPSKESYRLCIDYGAEKSAKVHKGSTAIDKYIGSVRDELERIRREEVVAYSRYCTAIRLQGPQTSMKNCKVPAEHF